MERPPRPSLVPKRIEIKVEPGTVACGNCKYLALRQIDPEDESKGSILNCVINPPTVYFGMLLQNNQVTWPSASGWPMVQTHQWCGKFELKIEQSN